MHYKLGQLDECMYFRISSCAADGHYDHVSAFISSNENDNTATAECHAFLCPKRKMVNNSSILAYHNTKAPLTVEYVSTIFSVTINYSGSKF